MENWTPVPTSEVYTVPSSICLWPIVHVEIWVSRQVVGIRSDGTRFSPREATTAEAVQLRFDTSPLQRDTQSFISLHAIIPPGIIGQFPDNLPLVQTGFSFTRHLSQIWEPLHEGKDPSKTTLDRLLLSDYEFRHRMIEEGAEILLAAVNDIDSRAAASPYDDIHSMIAALGAVLSMRGREELQAGLADIGIARYIAPDLNELNTKGYTDGQMITNGIRYILKIVRKEVTEFYGGEHSSPLIVSLAKGLFDMDTFEVAQTANYKRMLRGLHRIGLSQFLFD